MNFFDKNKFDLIFGRRLKILVLIAFFLLLWILIISIAGEFIVSNADQNWDKIENEKRESNKQSVINVFEKKEKSLLELSRKISSDSTLINFVSRNESQAIFSYLLSEKIPPSRSVEILNRRLESLGFAGREIPLEFYLLQKVLNGDTISVMKDIGFNSFLLIYLPITNPENNQIIGVIVTAELLDINSRIKTKFFEDKGITDEINRLTSTTCEIHSANTITGQVYITDEQYENKDEIIIYGLNGQVICVVLLNNLNKILYLEDIRLLQDKIISVIVFVLSLILIFIVTKLLECFPNAAIRISLLGVFLFLIRYSWLQFGFPSSTFDSEIFSPIFYASNFGFGIVRSVGELIVSSILLLYYIIYISAVLIKSSNLRMTPNRNVNLLKSIVGSFIILAAFFLFIELYGKVIQSIIFDSNIKFLDKVTIIPSIELFSIQSVVLLFSFSLFVLLSVLILYNVGLFRDGIAIKALKRNGIFLLYGIYLVANQIIESVYPGHEIAYLHRVLIITLIFIFAFICIRSEFLSSGFKFFSLRNFSIIVLFCIIVVPIVLFEKITSQETKYVELIGQKISENEDERLNFVIVDEIANLVNTPEVESFLSEPSKKERLAFYLWAESKLSSENYMSSVMVLDTNYEIISDFNFDQNILDADSVLSFMIQELPAQGYSLQLRDIIYTPVVNDTLAAEDYSWDEETEFFEEEENAPLIFGNIAVIKNEKENYFIGIAPLEKLDLKNTIFERKIGYLIITVQYETKNFVEPTTIDIFKTQKRDNLLDKIISKPIISEYINGEVVSSNDPDLAKISAVSIPQFREQVKFSENKTGWRIGNYDNEKLRTFYILNEVMTQDEEVKEVIYTISLRRDDFGLITFYYLKFILFTIFLYLIFYIILGAISLVTQKKIDLNFREKLFVSFFIVSVIPIILLAIYTRGFILNKNESSLKNQMVSDLNFINLTLSNYTSNGAIESFNQEANLSNIANQFSRSDKNFNLFVKSRLVSTTNEELYKSDLLDSRLDEEAYHNIIHQKKDIFIKSQDIGTLSYLVGYEPLLDSDGNIIGVISSQLVYKQNEINEELTETLTFIFGTYIIAIIALLIIVTFLSNRISKPILELKQATEKLSKGGNPELIQSKRKDEFGDLINSFNKMTSDLERSKTELKKAEREAAWRDIARRVAHEIKNPLTPMKLSIQHLVEVYNRNGKSDFASVLNKTKELITNEIDKLNKIATEFSNFAKMPSRNYTVLDVNEVINEVVSLYSSDKRIKFISDLSPEKLLVRADRQELNRIFQNLVKNSFQAITKSDGEIKINSYLSGKKVIVKLTDNGCGMSKETLDKLFEPNFSTKSTGMGLGLTITKKALNDMKAKISFESSEENGTTVELTFLAASMDSKFNPGKKY